MRSYYFSHDYNSRTDPNIKRMLVKHKMLGYGVYWAIIEDLYNNANALPLDYDTIAFDLHSDPLVVKSIINDFDLFIIEDNSFGSNGVQKRLEERETKSKKARQSAFKRWNNAKHNATAMQPQCEPNAIKEKKGKESKEKEKKVIPIYQEFKSYALENNSTIDLIKLELKYKAWVENNWKDGFNTPIKNWKTKLLNTIPHILKEKKGVHDSDF